VMFHSSIFQSRRMDAKLSIKPRQSVNSIGNKQGREIQTNQRREIQTSQHKNYKQYKEEPTLPNCK